MSSDLPEFNLVPDPRILPMLGEINLAQWRCFAELIDNSLDGFLAASRAGNPVADPSVIVNIPTSDVASARVTVRDNGRGMAPDILERAVRAGWTRNSPIGNLGMFGLPPARTRSPSGRPRCRVRRRQVDDHCRCAHRTPDANTAMVSAAHGERRRGAGRRGQG